MNALSNERIAYFNGNYVPESEVRVPFRDRSWLYGDGAFDMTRTFNGRVFKIEEHVERLYRSLKYLRIDPGLSPARDDRDQRGGERAQPPPARAGRGPLGRAAHLARRASRRGRQLGPLRPDRDRRVHAAAARARARLFRDGIDVIVPSVRRVPPDSLTPRAKTHNYLNLVMADLEAHARDPESWAVLLDHQGNLCEGLGSNIFVVRERRAARPTSASCCRG